MVSGSKLWPGLSLAPLAAEGGELPVIVRYRPSSERVPRARALTGATVERHYRYFPFVAMRVSADGLRQLEQDPAVERIWPDLPVRAFLDQAVPFLHVPDLWQIGYTGQGMRIAIVDTGVDPNHPDLAGRVAASSDFTGEGPQDALGHGTHVAGIAAGSGAASEGRYRGVAPEATLYSAKVLGADGGGMTSWVIAGLEWALDQHAHVINLSLGSSGSSDGTDALSVACDTVMAKGTVVCVAAGTDGPGEHTIGSPGAAQQVITVGASTLPGQVADFSSRGPTADGRVKPDLVLPGANITSCRAAGTSMGAVVNEHYTTASGTSMATPFATGMAALLLEAFHGLRPLEVKERLKRTAIDLGLSPYAQGAGQADALRAYKDEQEPQPPEPPEPPEPPPSRPGCLGLPCAFVRRLRARLGSRFLCR
jgi:subtilisin family serine protease